MSRKLYDGTSAYKIEEYYSYAENAQKRQEEHEEQAKTKKSISRVKLFACVSVVFVVAVAFLWANATLIETNGKVSELSETLEESKAHNTQLAFDIASSVNLEEIEEKAVNDFGMQKPESYQNVYVDVVQSDYTKVATSTQEDENLIKKMINGFKSFLSYIN